MELLTRRSLDEMWECKSARVPVFLHLLLLSHNPLSRFDYFQNSTEINTIELEELLYERHRRAFHFGGCSEENYFSLFEENHSTGELLRQTHIVRYDDASQP